MPLKEICINRINRLGPNSQQRIVDDWNLYAALQVHKLLAIGSLEEQNAAQTSTAHEVYVVVADYLKSYTKEVDLEEAAVESYYIDPALYAKLIRMAKRGLSFKEGELPE